MHNNIAMPIAATARVLRPKRCETCGAHGTQDSGEGIDCRIDGIKLILIPRPGGPPTALSVFPRTEAHWWCPKWIPLIEQAVSLEGPDLKR